ncbi:hypothetical protein LEP1GSC088_0597 [Leptospira interrogans str. L1207]|nr:hypothetical protein LEP1GSC088_0597 [Leptospira interrogans str. L1207]
MSCVLFYCVTTEPQKGTAKQIYSDCMETFQDSEKCEKLVLKQVLGSDKAEIQTETEKNLRLRSEIKDNLQGQNRIFVKEFLGNPDQVQFRTNGIEAYIYTRPVSRHKLGVKPDLEIRVLMRNGTVVRVEHVAP